MRNRRERRVQKPKKIKIKNNYGKTRKRDIVAPFIIIPILCIYFFAIAKVGIYVAKYINQVRTEFAAIAKELTTIDIANSSIVNEKGEVIAVLNADEKRQIISLDEMSKYLPLAYISIEDESYVKSIFKCISKFDNIMKYSVEDPSLNEIFISVVGDSYDK